MKKIILGLGLALFEINSANATSIKIDISGTTASATTKTEEVKLYNFSPELINAAQSCSPYEENFNKNNPELSKSIPFMGKQKMDVNINIAGKDENGNCKVNITQKIPGMMTFLYNCTIAPDLQKELVSAMQDRSATPITETFTTYMTSTYNGETKKTPMQQTMTDGKFNIVWAKTIGTSCETSEQEPTQEEQQALKDNFNNLSASFQTSLQNCKEDREEKSLMMLTETIEIIGWEKEKCHIKYQDFDLYIPQDKLSTIKTIPNITDLLTDESITRYKPKFQTRGLVSRLKDCPSLQNPYESFRSSQKTNNIEISNKMSMEKSETECIITFENSVNINKQKKTYLNTCRVNLDIIPELTTLITDNDKMLEVLEQRNRCQLSTK